MNLRLILIELRENAGVILAAINEENAAERDFHAAWSASGLDIAPRCRNKGHERWTQENVFV